MQRLGEPGCVTTGPKLGASAAEPPRAMRLGPGPHSAAGYDVQDLPLIVSVN